MELRHLRYFVAVADAGHFRQAAANLNVTQPNLSRHVQALERELEVELFVRLKRGVRLSSAGQALLEDAKRIIDEADQAAERARRVARGQIGTLRLACSEPASAHPAVTETIRDFRASEPDVELLVQHMVSSHQLFALRSGAIDAGFVFRAPELGDEFDSKEIDVLPSVIALPQSHPLAERASLRLADLAGESLICIARRINPPFYDSLVAACRRAGLAPHIIQETSSGIVLSLVSVGMGIGVISSAMQWRAPRGIALRRVEDLPIRSSLDLVWRRDNDSSVLQRFVSSTAAIADRLRSGAIARAV
jgi:DNA-binding transcriptional LysR family regulator